MIAVVSPQARAEAQQCAESFSDISEEEILQACQEAFHNGTILPRHVQIWEKNYVKQLSRERFSKKAL